MSELRAALLFDKYDQNYSGDIDCVEFTSMIKEMGLDFNSGQIWNVFEDLDTSGDGFVTRDEFFNFYMKYADESGSITASSAKAAMI